MINIDEIKYHNRTMAKEYEGITNMLSPIQEAVRIVVSLMEDLKPRVDKAWDETTLLRIEAQFHGKDIVRAQGRAFLNSDLLLIEFRPNGIMTKRDVCDSAKIFAAMSK